MSKLIRNETENGKKPGAFSYQYPFDKSGGNRYITFLVKRYKVEVKQEEPIVTPIHLGAIRLYMPNDFSEDMSQNWNAEEIYGKGIKDIAKTAVAKSVANITEKLGGGLAVNELKRSRKQIINPKEELLYMGPNFRSFSFVFEFAPKNSDEELMIKNIIHSFRRNSLPSGSFNQALLNFPPLWNIVLKDENFADMGFKDRQFALVNISTNFTPEGEFVTLKSGWPVKVTMTLSFQETRVLYREELKDTI